MGLTRKVCPETCLPVSRENTPGGGRDGGVRRERPDDRAHAIAMYEIIVEAMKATVSPERILVHTVRAGGQPLCADLGVSLGRTVAFAAVVRAVSESFNRLGDPE